MHERDEADFKRQFAASYLAAWAAQNSLISHAATAPSTPVAEDIWLPVAMAAWLSDEAWVRWVAINGVDRSTPETPNHCYRVMDDPSYDQP